MIVSPTLAFWQTRPRTIRSREIRGSAAADDPVGHIGLSLASVMGPGCCHEEGTTWRHE
jgi:hypothetical protein